MAFTFVRLLPTPEEIRESYPVPENCKKTAIRPRIRPVTTMPVVDEKKLKLFFMRPPKRRDAAKVEKMRADP